MIVRRHRAPRVGIPENGTFVVVAVGAERLPQSAVLLIVSDLAIERPAVRTRKLAGSWSARQDRSAADKAAMDGAKRWCGQGCKHPGMARQLGRHASGLVAGESCAQEGIGVAPIDCRTGGTAARAAIATGDEYNTVGGVCTRETLDDLAGLAIDCESLTGEADRGRTTDGQRGRGGVRNG